MLYSALVLDNSNFYTKGVITVRIARYYNAPMTWDLSDDDGIMNEFKEMNEKDEVEDYDNCLVSSPMGSGRNYGMFYLPQINSVGMVTFLDNSFSRPLWMGGFFRPIRTEPDSKKQRKVEFVNIPNDDITAEGEDSDGSSGEIGGKQTTAEDSALIIRMKSTDSDNYNWQEQDTENLIVIDKNNVKIIHFLEWDNNVAKKYQMIEINGRSGEIKLSSINETDETQTDFSVRDDRFNLKVTAGSEITGIEGRSGEDSVVKIQKGSNTKVILSENETIITASGAVRITGNPVFLGNKDGFMVTSSKAGAVESFNDLTATDKVRA